MLSQNTTKTITQLLTPRTKIAKLNTRIFNSDPHLFLSVDVSGQGYKGFTENNVSSYCHQCNTHGKTDDGNEMSLVRFFKIFLFRKEIYTDIYIYNVQLFCGEFRSIAYFTHVLIGSRYIRCSI